jgi:hypothetical protein
MYFATKTELYDSPTDIDSYANTLHSTIYSYFSTNFGLHTNTSPPVNDWSSCSTSELKTELKRLKLVPNRDVLLVKALAKFIRNKLSHASKAVPKVKLNFVNSFWKSCQAAFENFNSVTPTFPLHVASSYFKDVLASKGFFTFSKPSWLPNFPDPSIPFNMAPPSYQEVTRAINKMKNSSSPCPLDQIPVIPFKKCPILRTFLHKLLVSCWSQSKIPKSWGQGLTILIYKKGATDLPESFRPITLQSIPYKILSSILRSRITNFLMVNKLVNTTIQKGFWPRSNGVTEHTSMLSHMLEDAKRHHRSMVVTLLDLRNAFGEVSHSLIFSALSMHNIPPQIINFISNIYQSASVSISVNNSISSNISVSRGVLQGDPCSPLLFNICFNTLVHTINQEKFKSLGLAWGPSSNPCATSWLQFADDSALISHDCRSAQSLVDIAVAWCNWSKMSLRPDKCVSFGMSKIKGSYGQFEPKLFIDGSPIPTVKPDTTFKYLGKLFSFQLDNLEVKKQLVAKLKNLLEKISALAIPIQIKLKIVRLYLPTQFNFELRLYDLSQTWIQNELDTAIINSIRDWFQYPTNSCVAEIIHLPLSYGGLGIPSLKFIAAKQSLSVRANLKVNSDPSMRLLWEATSPKNIPTDARIVNSTLPEAVRNLSAEALASSLNHIESLTVQGPSISSISSVLGRQEIKRWSNFSLSLPDNTFKFVRKALQNQLATASNMKLWHRIPNNLCTLCKCVQTNKHVLSNCSFPGSLSRYTDRHNDILRITANYIKSSISSSSTLYADLPNNNSIATLFHSQRPDLAIITGNKITVLELTVCHETNLESAKLRKLEKYENLRQNLNPAFCNCDLKIFTLEVTVLGFISDLSSFVKFQKIEKFPVSVLNAVSLAAIVHSKDIYHSRDQL